MLEMAESEGNKPIANGRRHGANHGTAHRLLRLAPPHGCDDDHGREVAALEQAQQEATDQDGGGVGAGGVAHFNDPPEEDVDGEVLACGEALQHPQRWEDANQEGYSISPFSTFWNSRDLDMETHRNT